MFLSRGSPTRSVDRPPLQFVDEPIVDRLLDEESAPGATDVALIEEDAVDDSLDRLIHRGVVEYDVGSLAAQFEGDLLAGPGQAAANELADCGRAGEGNLVDVAVIDQARTRGTGAGNDVEHPGGSPASAASEAKINADSGVVSAGFSTTVLPVASAGATFQASIIIGKFHGITWPATPSGCGSRPGNAYSSLSAHPA